MGFWRKKKPVELKREPLAKQAEIPRSQIFITPQAVAGMVKQAVDERFVGVNSAVNTRLNEIDQHTREQLKPLKEKVQHHDYQILGLRVGKDLEDAGKEGGVKELSATLRLYHHVMGAIEHSGISVAGAKRAIKWVTGSAVALTVTGALIVGGSVFSGYVLARTLKENRQVISLNRDVQSFKGNQESQASELEKLASKYSSLVEQAKQEKSDYDAKLTQLQTNYVAEIKLMKESFFRMLANEATNRITYVDNTVAPIRQNFQDLSAASCSLDEQVSQMREENKGLVTDIAEVRAAGSSDLEFYKLEVAARFQRAGSDNNVRDYKIGQLEFGLAQQKGAYDKLLLQNTNSIPPGKEVEQQMKEAARLKLK